MYRDTDIRFMRRALSLAKKGAGMTGVNPMVGAVIVKGARVLGEGWHVKSKLDHAEIVAMRRVSSRRLKGAVMYVTLEPCCHTKKTTPPCVKKIIAAGLSRVVVAMKDPNPMVNGKGIAILRKAGIEADVGLMKDKAEEINRFYIKSIGTSLPYVTLKQAVSLDGKVAAKDGGSKWISGSESRREVHGMRKVYDAVMTTGITVKADNPSLSVRAVKGRNPQRIIVDWNLITAPEAKVYRDKDVLLIVDVKTASTSMKPFRDKGIPIFIHDRRKGMRALFRNLYGMGFGSILVESGGRFAARLMREKVLDGAVYFVAPVFLGNEGIGSVGDLGINTMLEKLKCRIVGVKMSGRDIRVEVSFI